MDEAICHVLHQRIRVSRQWIVEVVTHHCEAHAVEYGRMRISKCNWVVATNPFLFGGLYNLRSLSPHWAESYHCTIGVNYVDSVTSP